MEVHVRFGGRAGETHPRNMDRALRSDPYTEHPTAEGRLYCAAVMDAYSRLIIGWSLAGHMRTELVTDALGMAILAVNPTNSPTTTLRFYIPIMARNILLGRSGNACFPPGCSPRWARSAACFDMR